MYLCPRCHQNLSQKVDSNGVTWECAKCGGKAMGFGVLRKSIDPLYMAEALHLAATTAGRDGCSCPMCSKPMTMVNLEMNVQSLTLDLCQPCGFAWFDAAEFEAIPPMPAPLRVLGEIDLSKMTPEAQEKLAMIVVKEIADQARSQDPTPDESWKTAPAMLGMPVELDAPPMARIPWATYTLSLVIVAVSLTAFTNLDLIVDHYGLIPDDAWRDHGLTLLTSFFLHVGWGHLIGNIYFLLIFGRSVENNLGPWRWLLLIFAADQFGNALHILGNLDESTPCIGASGGISGLLAYYALHFPKMRLATIFYYRWIEFPAWTAFVVWVGLQIFGAVSQHYHYGYSSVATLAHLGGCIPGVIFYWIWGRPPFSPDTRVPGNPFQIKID